MRTVALDIRNQDCFLRKECKLSGDSTQPGFCLKLLILYLFETNFIYGQGCFAPVFVFVQTCLSYPHRANILTTFQVPHPLGWGTSTNGPSVFVCCKSLYSRDASLCLATIRILILWPASMCISLSWPLYGHLMTSGQPSSLETVRENFSI